MKGQNVLKETEGASTRFIFGDLVAESSESKGNLAEWLKLAKGNFIITTFNRKELQIASSAFGVLPVFYYRTANAFWISDSLEILVQNARISVSLCRVHLLERLLFNYTLTNRTMVEGIRQFPVNNILTFNDRGCSFDCYLDIFQYYSHTPRTLRESKKKLVEEFSRLTKQYLPSEKYASAFTGGFDGRCIVATGLRENNDFESYSFGVAKSDDVVIPRNAASKVGFEYSFIDLNHDYLNKEFRKQAEAMVYESNGMSTTSRAHYRYGSIILSQKYNFLLSGNFGSELFRSAHLDGVMTTKTFYQYISEGLPSTFEDFLKKNSEFCFLNDSSYSKEYSILKLELEIKKNDLPSIPLNAQLYYLLWSDTIRNYFGPELVMQQKYIVHRSPFLDLEFFRELQKTEFSGAYGNFREKNLVKRMKGQLFYAHFLKRTNTALFKCITGKGYRPSDMLSPIGMARILLSKIFAERSDVENDPLRANEGFLQNKEDWVADLSEVGFQGKNVQAIDSRLVKTLISANLFLKHLQSNSN